MYALPRGSERSAPPGHRRGPPYGVRSDAQVGPIARGGGLDAAGTPPSHCRLPPPTEGICEEIGNDFDFGRVWIFGDPPLNSTTRYVIVSRGILSEERRGPPPLPSLASLPPPRYRATSPYLPPYGSPATGLDPPISTVAPGPFRGSAPEAATNISPSTFVRAHVCQKFVWGKIRPPPPPHQKTFIGKIVDPGGRLPPNRMASKGRWVYEGSELK